MSVSVDDVKYVAKLSMLQFEENELLKFTSEFNKIIEYIDQLNDLDTKDVEPLYHPIEGNKAFMRDDVVVQSIDIETAFKNAPTEVDGYFKVPKVI
jgi:aspartyl-tRNA(Asn)/glutamyl-tRNA(Gln) amidotransferase subunit C